VSSSWNRILNRVLTNGKGNVVVRRKPLRETMRTNSDNVKNIPAKRATHWIRILRRKVSKSVGLPLADVSSQFAVGRKIRRSAKNQVLSKHRKKRYRLDGLRSKKMGQKKSGGKSFSAMKPFLCTWSYKWVRSKIIRREDSCCPYKSVYQQKKMLWGCFSYYGIGKLCPNEGMMRSPHYIEVFRRGVVPEESSSENFPVVSFKIN